MTDSPAHTRKAQGFCNHRLTYSAPNTGAVGTPCGPSETHMAEDTEDSPTLDRCRAIVGEGEAARPCGRYVAAGSGRYCPEHAAQYEPRCCEVLPDGRTCENLALPGTKFCGEHLVGPKVLYPGPCPEGPTDRLRWLIQWVQYERPDLHKMIWRGDEEQARQAWGAIRAMLLAPDCPIPLPAHMLEEERKALAAEQDDPQAPAHSLQRRILDAGIPLPTPPHTPLEADGAFWADVDAGNRFTFTVEFPPESPMGEVLASKAPDPDPWFDILSVIRKDAPVAIHDKDGNFKQNTVALEIRANIRTVFHVLPENAVGCFIHEYWVQWPYSEDLAKALPLEKVRERNARLNLLPPEQFRQPQVPVLLEGHTPKRRPEALPPIIHQGTYQEARNLTQALHDAALPAPGLPDQDRPAKNWQIVPRADGEAAVWSRPRDPIQVRLEPVVSTVWGLDIRQCLAQFGGRKGALATLIVLGRLLEEETVAVWFDELVDLLHLPTRDKKGNKIRNARQAHRLWLWHLAQTWPQTVVVGTRRGTYTRDGKSIEIATDAPLILLDERLRRTRAQGTCEQLAFDGTPADGVVLRRGSLLERFAGDSRILPYYGNLRLLAELPTGQPTSALAQSIGLSLHQLWREKAAREAGKTLPVGRRKVPTSLVFTRRELCELFPDQNPDLLALAQERPRRARQYWDDSIKLLQANAKGEIVPGQAIGTIGAYQELDPTPAPKPGEQWPATWWYREQRLLIAPREPEGEVLQNVQTAQLKRLASRKRAEKARERKAERREAEAQEG